MFIKEFLDLQTSVEPKTVYEVTDILMQEVALENEEQCILEELKHHLDKFAKQWLTQWHLRMALEMLQFEWVE